MKKVLFIFLILMGNVFLNACSEELLDPVKQEGIETEDTTLPVIEEEQEEQNHYIGELYSGGVVFYVDSSKKHGLVASLKYLSNSITFSDVTTKIIGIDAQSKDDGSSNTKAIVNQEGQQNSAAKICLDYSVDGYDDWYLSSINELLLFQKERKIVSSVLDNTLGADSLAGGFDWSSTEVNAETSYGLSCSTSLGMLKVYKDQKLKVRAIRAF